MLMSFWLPAFSLFVFFPLLRGEEGGKKRESNNYRNKNEGRRKRRKL